MLRTLRLVFILLPIIIFVACSGSSSSGAGGVGRGDSCQIRDSSRLNGYGSLADVREAICETSAGFLAPDVASMFVFVRDSSMQQSSSNIALRYEVVCPDKGDCNYRRPNVTWINRYSLRITLGTLGDIYCVQRTNIDRINISYSKIALRNPPQDAFTSLKDLCQ